MKMPMNLTYINKIRIAFCPFFDPPSTREFLSRVSTKKAMATNPKCEVKCEVLPFSGFENPVPTIIDITYQDGSQQTIQKKSEDLQLAEEIKEMKANPVTGPVPVSVIKGRRHTYAVYAEDAEKKTRAAGGVKTIKKK